jgi:hypothetical protein
MSSVDLFGITYRCEQLFSLMKNVKSRNRKRLTDEHLERYMRKETTEMNPNIERLMKQEQCQIFQ